MARDDADVKWTVTRPPTDDCKHTYEVKLWISIRRDDRSDMDEEDEEYMPREDVSLLIPSDNVAIHLLSIVLERPFCKAEEKGTEDVFWGNWNLYWPVKDMVRRLFMCRVDNVAGMDNYQRTHVDTGRTYIPTEKRMSLVMVLASVCIMDGIYREKGVVPDDLGFDVFTFRGTIPFNPERVRDIQRFINDCTEVVPGGDEAMGVKVKSPLKIWRQGASIDLDEHVFAHAHYTGRDMFFRSLTYGSAVCDVPSRSGPSIGTPIALPIHAAMEPVEKVPPSSSSRRTPQRKLHQKRLERRGATPYSDSDPDPYQVALIQQPASKIPVLSSPVPVSSAPSAAGSVHSSPGPVPSVPSASGSAHSVIPGPAAPSVPGSTGVQRGPGSISSPRSVSVAEPMDAEVEALDGPVGDPVSATAPWRRSAVKRGRWEPLKMPNNIDAFSTDGTEYSVEQATRLWTLVVFAVREMAAFYVKGGFDPSWVFGINMDNTRVDPVVQTILDGGSTDNWTFLINRINVGSDNFVHRLYVKIDQVVMFAMFSPGPDDLVDTVTEDLEVIGAMQLNRVEDNWDLFEPVTRICKMLSELDVVCSYNKGTKQHADVLPLVAAYLIMDAICRDDEDFGKRNRLSRFASESTDGITDAMKLDEFVNDRFVFESNGPVNDGSDRQAININVLDLQTVDRETGSWKKTGFATILDVAASGRGLLFRCAKLQRDRLLPTHVQDTEQKVVAPVGYLERAWKLFVSVIKQATPFLDYDPVEPTSLMCWWFFDIKYVDIEDLRFIAERLDASKVGLTGFTVQCNDVKDCDNLCSVKLISDGRVRVSCILPRDPSDVERMHDSLIGVVGDGTRVSQSMAKFYAPVKPVRVKHITKNATGDHRQTLISVSVALRMAWTIITMAKKELGTEYQTFIDAIDFEVVMPAGLDDANNLPKKLGFNERGDVVVEFMVLCLKKPPRVEKQVELEGKENAGRRLFVNAMRLYQMFLSCRGDEPSAQPIPKGSLDRGETGPMVITATTAMMISANPNQTELDARDLAPGSPGASVVTDISDVMAQDVSESVEADQEEAGPDAPRDSDVEPIPSAPASEAPLRRSKRRATEKTRVKLRAIEAGLRGDGDSEYNSSFQGSVTSRGTSQQSGFNPHALVSADPESGSQAGSSRPKVSPAPPKGASQANSVAQEAQSEPVDAGGPEAPPAKAHDARQPEEPEEPVQQQEDNGDDVRQREEPEEPVQQREEDNDDESEAEQPDDGPADDGRGQPDDGADGDLSTGEAVGDGDRSGDEAPDGNSDGRRSDDRPGDQPDAQQPENAGSVVTGISNLVGVDQGDQEEEQDDQDDSASSVYTPGRAGIVENIASSRPDSPQSGYFVPGRSHIPNQSAPFFFGGDSKGASPMDTRDGGFDGPNTQPDNSPIALQPMQSSPLYARPVHHTSHFPVRLATSSWINDNGGWDVELGGTLNYERKTRTFSVTLVEYNDGITIDGNGVIARPRGGRRAVVAVVEDKIDPKGAYGFQHSWVFEGSRHGFTKVSPFASGDSKDDVQRAFMAMAVLRKKGECAVVVRSDSVSNIYTVVLRSKYPHDVSRVHLDLRNTAVNALCVDMAYYASVFMTAKQVAAVLAKDSVIDTEGRTGNVTLTVFDQPGDNIFVYGDPRFGGSVHSVIIRARFETRFAAEYSASGNAVTVEKLNVDTHI